MIARFQCWIKIWVHRIVECKTNSLSSFDVFESSRHKASSDATLEFNVPDVVDRAPPHICPDTVAAQRSSVAPHLLNVVVSRSSTRVLHVVCERVLSSKAQTFASHSEGPSLSRTFLCP